MHWHGGLSTSLDDEQMGRIYNPRMLFRLLAYARPYWLLTAFSIFTIVVYTLTSVAIPWVVQRAIDSVVTNHSLAGLRSALALFAVVVAFNYAASMAHLLALGRLGQSILFDLRTQLFNHLQRLSLSFYDKNEVGRIMSRGQNDVQQLQEFFSTIVLGLGDLLTLIGIVVAMLLMDWRLALIVLSVLPVLVLLMALWQRPAWRVFMRVRGAIAAVNAGLQENITGVRVVQALNREDQNLQHFDQLNYHHLDA
ncbi:MAG: ABC transporter transmembrane domain-containing protein, partial [Chloroflexota bacterium]|nr:ABC transporter transmembrane domain-containing protein [Chloroflexota bacterium]